MTVEIVRIAREHRVDVRVAARAQQVMASAAPSIHPICAEGIFDDRDHWSQIWEARPEAVIRRDVACV